MPNLVNTEFLLPILLIWLVKPLIVLRKAVPALSDSKPLFDNTPSADAVSAKLMLLAFAAVPTYDIAIPKSLNPVEVASAE